MKKVIFTVALLSAFMMSCNDNQKTNTETSLETEIHDDAHEHHAMSLNNDWVKDIKLDNGTKWDANLETTEGVESMLTLIKEIDPQNLEDYQNLANKLNDVKNHVVKECTMEGKSHDNLHVFLHPLIEKIDALEKVEKVEEGAELTASIKENLGAYYNYFK